MGWVKGRQGTGYEKFKIFQFLNMDCYILRYKEGDSIPWHTDPVPNRKHYRLNIELKKAKLGGLFMTRRINQGSQYISVPHKRINFFRSDIEEHSVTKIKKGSRYVLTFGIAL